MGVSYKGIMAGKRMNECTVSKLEIRRGSIFMLIHMIQKQSPMAIRLQLLSVFVYF